MANKKVITEIDIINLLRRGKYKFEISGNEIFTPAALDKIKENSVELIKIDGKKSILELSEKNLAKRKLVIGSDHTGYKIKQILIQLLKSQGFEILDVGTDNENSCDYPDFAIKVAEEIKNGNADFGILIDATGIPSAITANKIPGIRAATCYNEFSAQSSREHNNSNVLVIGAKTLGEESIKSVLSVWLNSVFLGERHQKRLDKISDVEKKYSK